MLLFSVSKHKLKLVYYVSRYKHKDKEVARDF